MSLPASTTIGSSRPARRSGRARQAVVVTGVIPTDAHEGSAATSSSSAFMRGRAVAERGVGVATGSAPYTRLHASRTLGRRKRRADVLPRWPTWGRRSQGIEPRREDDLDCGCKEPHGGHDLVLRVHGLGNVHHGLSGDRQPNVCRTRIGIERVLRGSFSSSPTPLEPCCGQEMLVLGSAVNRSRGYVQVSLGRCLV